MDRQSGRQQRTLPVRISERVRKCLARARYAASSERGAASSLSRVAVTLFVPEEHYSPEEQAELFELMKKPTETLVAIRGKWEEKRSLSRPEWMALTYYVQTGCEGMGADSGPPSRESFVDLLEGLLALLKARTRASWSRDQCYLNEIGATGWTHDREFNAANVFEVLSALIHELRKPECPLRPAFSGRPLHVAVRADQFPSVASINEALTPFLPTLFRLAARGHWLLHHRPVRALGQTSQNYGIPDGEFPPVHAGGFQLATVLTDDGDLAMALSMLSRDAICAFGPFPEIREFAALLEQLRPGAFWKGPTFRGYTDGSDDKRATRFYFQRRSTGTSFGFSPQEWNQVREVFRETLGSAQMVPVVAELSIQYGGLNAVVSPVMSPSTWFSTKSSLLV